LINKLKEIPTLCLWLGYILEAKQELKKAAQCWRLAIRRDRPGGAVALAAQQPLQRYAMTMSKVSERHATVHANKLRYR
jgi:hypothetical protein